MSDIGVRARGLTKAFRRYQRPRDRLIEWLSLGTVIRHTLQVALEPIDLEVAPGQCLGIIGENGAGKSTLLKLISGVLHPTGGSVATEGRVVSLLELGAGFRPELDGVANVFESARLLGYHDGEIRPRLEAILAFAELGEHAHHPVRTYSSGMFVRLAFSLFAHLDPAIYIVDEALAVGDVFFQQKCFAFLESLKARGVVVILASHDMQAILRLCDSAVLLERGRAVRRGSPLEVVNAYYERHGAGREPLRSVPAPAAPPLEDGSCQVPADAALGAGAARNGSGEVEILGVRFASPDGEPAQQARKGERIVLELWAAARADLDDLTFGFQMTDRMNTVIFGQTLYLKDRTVLRARRGESFRVDFQVDLQVETGQYVFEVFATDCQLDVPNAVYDRLPRARVLDVLTPERRTAHGLVELATRYTVRRYAE